MPDELTIRKMRRPELDMLVDWAANEGWNPGLHDDDVFWANDPDAFIAAELEREIIGGGAVTSYGGEFGFMGFFIVRPEFRGRGLGNTLWRVRRERLLSRLNPGAAIGLDGVFDMQDYYAKGGFVFSHRNLRFRAVIADVAAPADDENVVALSDVPFDEISAYDRSCFPASRATFLERWIALPDALALGLRRDGTFSGYGVIRRCREGCKVGPLFADDAAGANALYDRLAAFAEGGSLYLDVPENNAAAMALVERKGMTEVFGCARMYLGSPPDVADDRVFGVTTFELG